MTALTPSRATLADVLAAIDVAEPPGRRLQDLASAVRTIAKALGRPLQDIPADPRLLGIRLKSISPLALSISMGRWNNVRSLFRQALRLVQPMMPGRAATPLSEDWAVLFEKIFHRRSERIRLSRLVHWLSAHQIASHAVTLQYLEQFHSELMNAALLGKPELTWRDTALAWNRSVKLIPGWPQVTLDLPSRKEVYVLPWQTFPMSFKQDVEAWLDRLACRDFADDGPIKAVKPSTLATRQYQLRSFASALVHRGRDPASLTSLAACLTFENFAEGLRFFRERRAGQSTTTVHSLASMLKSVAAHWVKASDQTIARMKAAIAKLAVEQKGMTTKNRERLRQLEDPVNRSALLNLPQNLRQQIDRGKIGNRRASYMAQAAVAMEILLFCPIRMQNLSTIDLDRHFVRVGNKLHLVIPGDEVKNGAELEFALPSTTQELIEWYISEHRSAAAVNRALFPGAKGGAKTKGALRQQIIKTVHEFTGLCLHPHLFRHFAAQNYLDQHPGGYEVVRRVLAHKDMATTTSFYTGLQTRKAGQHFATTIEGLRRQSGEGRLS